ALQDRACDRAFALRSAVARTIEQERLELHPDELPDEGQTRELQRAADPTHERSGQLAVRSRERREHHTEVKRVKELRLLDELGLGAWRVAGARQHNAQRSLDLRPGRVGCLTERVEGRLG